MPEHEQHPTKHVYRHAKITLVSDWTDAGVHGWAVVEQTVERLRTTGRCRYDPTAEPTLDHYYGIDPIRADELFIGGEDA